MAKEFSVNMLLLSPLNAFVHVRTAVSINPAALSVFDTHQSGD